MLSLDESGSLEDDMSIFLRFTAPFIMQYVLVNITAMAYINITQLCK